RDPHLLLAPLVVWPPVEPAIERFDLEPGDLDEALPFRARRPPERDRRALRQRDVDPIVRRNLVDPVPDARVLLPGAVDLGRDVGIEDEDVPGEPPARC